MIQPATNGRPDHRHKRHAHGDITDHGSRAFGWNHIAHNGAADGKTAGDGGLNQAADQEDGKVRGIKCADGGGDKDRRGGQQNGPATEPVRYRADHQLQNSRHAKVGSDGQLHHAIINAEMRGHRIKRGQEDVQRKGGKPRNKDQRGDMRRGGAIKKADMYHPAELGR